MTNPMFEPGVSDSRDSFQADFAAQENGFVGTASPVKQRSGEPLQRPGLPGISKPVRFA